MERPSSGLENIEQAAEELRMPRAQVQDTLQIYRLLWKLEDLGQRKPGVFPWKTRAETEERKQERVKI